MSIRQWLREFGRAVIRKQPTEPLRIEMYDDGDAILASSTRMVWLDADMCVVDEHDVCQRGDHPTPQSECYPEGAS